jgi:hypothetical protein
MIYRNNLKAEDCHHFFEVHQNKIVITKIYLLFVEQNHLCKADKDIF